MKRNPGPGWGYTFLQLCDRFLPDSIFKGARFLASGIALLLMPQQRKHSATYLSKILPRPVAPIDLWLHFDAFAQILIAKLRIPLGFTYHCTLAQNPSSLDFENWLQSTAPMLLGTFHVGASDLLGFQLGGVEKRRIHLVREQVGNSSDTEQLSKQYGDWIQFIWVNNQQDLIFSLKDTLSQDDTIVALQCDRINFSSRTEAFDFLGAKRLFPFTIYHLAAIFQRPVLLSVGIPSSENTCTLHCSPQFTPNPSESRKETLQRAKIHFQNFLSHLESLLHSNPYLWFNFLELNPVATP